MPCQTSQSYWTFDWFYVLKSVVLFLFNQDFGGSYTISWNHQEFEVRYECLNEEIKIGDYYLRLLLEDQEENITITNSLVFYNNNSQIRAIYSVRLYNHLWFNNHCPDNRQPYFCFEGCPLKLHI